MRFSFVFYLATFSFILFPSFSSAQFGEFAPSSQALPEISIRPDFPEPNDVIEVTIVNSGSSLDGSTITWFLDNIEIPESRNLKKFEIKLTDGSQPKTLLANISTPSGLSFPIVKEITPLYLDLIIEPQTHVPEFYLGRPLPSYSSVVNVTAIVSGERILNPDLIYTWRVGRVVLEGDRLRGRNKISFDVPRDTQFILSVEVSDLLGNRIAGRSVLLFSVQPELKFYESNLLFGLKQKPISGALNMVGKTVIVRAVPYYLDSRVYNQPEILEWKIDRQNYQIIGGNPYEITLEKTGASGRSLLDFHVRDTKQVLQGARNSVYVNI